jgi:hypothetical protein
VVGQKRCPLSFVRQALSFVHPPLTHHSSSSYRHSIWHTIPKISRMDKVSQVYKCMLSAA